MCPISFITSSRLNFGLYRVTVSYSPPLELWIVKLMYILSWIGIGSIYLPERVADNS